MIEYLPVNQQGKYTLLSGYRNYAKGVKNTQKTQKVTINWFSTFYKISVT